MIFNRRLFALTRGERRSLAVASLLGLAAVPLELWRLAITGAALAAAFTGAALPELVLPAAAAAALLVARVALTGAKDRVALGVEARVKPRLRRMLYEKLLAIGPAHLAATESRTG